MRILILATTFNSLTQRIWIELRRRGHELSIEFDVNDPVTTEAVELYNPDLIVAPYLRRAIPEAVWSKVPCFVVHPGPIGDRGPNALDWAVLDGVPEWGVTVLQANAEFDAGDVWAQVRFPLRKATKSSLYRGEVTESAVVAVLEAVRAFERGSKPTPLARLVPDGGRFRPKMTDDDRRIDWASEPTDRVLAKLRASDGQPGVPDELFGRACRLFEPYSEHTLSGGKPGEVIAWRDGAILRATVDGAVWIGSVMMPSKPGERPFKVPASTAFRAELERVREVPAKVMIDGRRRTFQEIAYREIGAVGYLAFDFYNGAMSTDQCRALLEAYAFALSRPTRVIVFLGGREFWSNGMNLNTIEASRSPAEESWANINAIDDVAREIILTDDRVTIAALRGNAGAGGVFLALAADMVVARQGVVMNPHYKNMGNLFGSEYWTYLLPRRIGEEKARRLMETRTPICAIEAKDLGLVDAVFSVDQQDFLRDINHLAQDISAEAGFRPRIAEKRWQRWRAEQEKPLEAYRAEELEKMKLNFFGFDPSYHVARYNFVAKVPQSRTPLHLARHRLAPSVRRMAEAGE